MARHSRGNREDPDNARSRIRHDTRSGSPDPPGSFTASSQGYGLLAHSMNGAPIRTGPADVLIACGDEEGRREIQRALAYGNLACREAGGGEACARQIGERRPDLLILDLHLPDQSGIGVCRLLRESQPTLRLPIIMVSSQASEIDRVLAFESGADDFIARPFYPAELRARVEAVLRGFMASPRREPTAAGGRGPIALDARAGRVSVEGRPVDLTAREFSLLQELASHSGRVVRRRQLIEQLWGGQAPPTDRAIDAHIKSIRRKLGSARDCIETVRGVGYRFVDDPEPLVSAGGGSC
jgi:DNA-binding response OmpR family regulator